MQSAILAEGLLGSMSFRASVRKATARVLKPVSARVKAELPFLAEKEESVGVGRLQEVLVARARILNQDEKHNVWMVRNGRVARRRVRGQRVGREEVVETGAAEQDEGAESEVRPCGW